MSEALAGAPDAPGNRPSALQMQRAARLAAEPMQPAAPHGGFVSGSLQSIRDIWSHRQLLGLLVRRELRARYKDSVLGFFWSLMRPLALLAVYYVAVGKFLHAGDVIPDYAVYIYSGLTAWQLLSEIISTGTASILSNGGLVKKMYLPREVFPLSAIGSALFNFALQLIILIAATYLVGKPPWGTRLWYAVLALAVVLIYGAALAFLLSAVNVYLRDVQYLVEIALMFGLWTAPIVYSWTQVQSVLSGWMETLYLCNPVALAALGFQRGFWVAGDANPANFPAHLGTYLGVMIVVGVVVLWLCQRVFARLQNNFAQEL
jgi:ABC-2 type transport system permease protein